MVVATVAKIYLVGELATVPNNDALPGDDSGLRPDKISSEFHFESVEVSTAGEN